MLLLNQKSLHTQNLNKKKKKTHSFLGVKTFSVGALVLSMIPSPGILLRSSWSGLTVLIPSNVSSSAKTGWRIASQVFSLFLDWASKLAFTPVLLTHLPLSSHLLMLLARIQISISHLFYL